MKRHALTVVTTSALLMLGGCASDPVALEPQLQKGQEAFSVDGNDGQAGVTSKKVESVVSIETSPKHDLAKYGLPFTVSFFNGGIEPAQFGPGCISAMQGDQPLQIVTRQGLKDIQSEEQSAQSTSMMLGAIALGVAQGLGARGVARTPNAQPAPTNNALIQQYSDAASKQMLNGAQEARLLNEQFGKIALDDLSVGPLKTAGGFFLLKGYDGDQPVVVTIKVRDEAHVFTFARKSETPVALLPTQAPKPDVERSLGAGQGTGTNSLGQTPEGGLILTSSGGNPAIAEFEKVDVPLGQNAGSLLQVRKAVKLSLLDRQWNWAKETDKSILATYRPRDRTWVTIAITFDTSKASIAYVDSSSKDATPNDDEVRGRYGAWVGYLAKDIPLNLRRVQILTEGTGGQ